MFIPTQINEKNLLLADRLIWTASSYCNRFYQLFENIEFVNSFDVECGVMITDKHCSPISVVRAKKHYLEFFDFNYHVYALTKNDNTLCDGGKNLYSQLVQEILDTDPQTQADEEERKLILQDCMYYFEKYMEDDLYTRQFVIQPKYENNKDLAACISLLQFIVLDNRLYLNVYVRSQNIRNVKYDNYSYILYLLSVYNLISKKIDECVINVKIASLHKEKGE